MSESPESRTAKLVPAMKARATSNPTSHYEPSNSGAVWGGGLAAIDGKPFFTWYDIPRMMRDPRVRFLERMWRSPFQQVTWTVKATHPLVATYVDRQLHRFWRGSLPGLLARYFWFGFAPGGAEFIERKGMIRLDRVRALEPNDARPLVFTSGDFKGKMAGLEFGSTKVLMPHAYWFAGERKAGRCYDLPPASGMFEPWAEKRGRNGAVDMRRTWFWKNSSRSTLIRHPGGKTEATDEFPHGRENQSIAREIGDYGYANASYTLPSDLHPGSPDKYLWDIEWPESFPDRAGYREYPKDLDAEMAEGVGIPREVLEASATGSGYSGRMIPLQAWLGTADEYVGMILESLEWLKYAVQINFGPNAYFEVEPQSLVEKLIKDSNGGSGGAPAAAAAPAPQPQGNGWKPVAGPRGGHWEENAAGQRRHARYLGDERADGIVPEHIQRKAAKIVRDQARIRELSDGRTDPKTKRKQLMVMLAMLEFQRRAHSVNDPESSRPYLDKLSKFLHNPDSLRYPLQLSNLEALELSWRADETKTGHIKAIGEAEHAGKVLYGARAEAALRAQEGLRDGLKPGERQTPTPTPHPNRDQWQKAGVRAREILGKFAAGEHTPEELQELQQHLPYLPMDRLTTARSILRTQFKGVRGRLGQVNALMDHIREQVGVMNQKPEEEAKFADKLGDAATEPGQNTPKKPEDSAPTAEVPGFAEGGNLFDKSQFDTDTRNKAVQGLHTILGHAKQHVHTIGNPESKHAENVARLHSEAVRHEQDAKNIEDRMKSGTVVGLKPDTRRDKGRIEDKKRWAAEARAKAAKLEATPGGEADPGDYLEKLEAIDAHAAKLLGEEHDDQHDPFSAMKHGYTAAVAELEDDTSHYEPKEVLASARQDFLQAAKARRDIAHRLNLEGHPDLADFYERHATEAAKLALSDLAERAEAKQKQMEDAEKKAAEDAKREEEANDAAEEARNNAPNQPTLRNGQVVSDGDAKPELPSTEKPTPEQVAKRLATVNKAIAERDSQPGETNPAAVGTHPALAHLDPVKHAREAAHVDAGEDALLEKVRLAENAMNEAREARRTVGSRQPEARNSLKALNAATKAHEEATSEVGKYNRHEPNFKARLNGVAVDEKQPLFVRIAAAHKASSDKGNTIEVILPHVKQYLEENGHDPRIAEMVANDATQFPMRSAKKLKEVIQGEETRQKMHDERKEAREHIKGLDLLPHFTSEAEREAGNLYQGDVAKFKEKWSAVSEATKGERLRQAEAERKHKEQTAKENIAKSAADAYLTAHKFGKELPPVDSEAMGHVIQHATTAHRRWHAGAELPKPDTSKGVVDDIAKNPTTRFALVKTIAEQGWATDSKFAMKATPEMVEYSKAQGHDKLEGRTPVVKDFVATSEAKATTPAKLVANRKSDKGEPQILAQAEDGRTVTMSAQYVANIMKAYPGADIFMHDSHGPVLFKKDGKTIGLVMPLSPGHSTDDSFDKYDPDARLKVSDVAAPGPYKAEHAEEWSSGPVVAGRGENQIRLNVSKSGDGYAVSSSNRAGPEYGRYGSRAEAVAAARELLAHAHGMDESGNPIFKPKGEKSAPLHPEEQARLDYHSNIKEKVKAIKGKPKKMKFGDTEKDVTTATEHFGVAKDATGGWNTLHLPTGLSIGDWSRKEESLGHAIATQEMPDVDWSDTFPDTDNPEVKAARKDVFDRARKLRTAYENNDLPDHAKPINPPEDDEPGAGEAATPKPSQGPSPTSATSPAMAPKAGEQQTFAGWMPGASTARKPKPESALAEHIANSPTGWTGDDLVLISHAWDHVKDQPEYAGKTIADFKADLLKQAAEGKIALSRADMPQGMNQDDLRASHTQHPAMAGRHGGDFHFVKVQRVRDNGEDGRTLVKPEPAAPPPPAHPVAASPAPEEPDRVQSQQPPEPSHGEEAGSQRSGSVPEPVQRGNGGGSIAGTDGQSGREPVRPRIVTARPEHTKPGNPALIPESVRQHLNAEQQHGASLAIDAMEKHGGFLLADGTGVGKTRQQLAVGKAFLDKGKKVVIVSPAEVIKPNWGKGSMAGSFASDSAAMGVPVKLAKGDGDIQPGSVHITTYNELSKLKNKIDKDTVLILDESHFLKNRDSARHKHGKEAMEKAAAVMYATATPGDKPLHIAHLFRSGVFGNAGATKTYEKLGMKLVDQHIGGGQTVKCWQIDPKVGYAEATRRLSGLFDQMTKDGLMVKRELSMQGVDVGTHHIEMTPEQHADVNNVYERSLSENSGNKAVALMAARLHQEPMKIPATVKMIQEEIADGRSPVVFMGRVNDIGNAESEAEDGDDETRSLGTAKALKAALIAAGVPEADIGELHGGATKTAEQKKKSMEGFQSGKHKIMLATVQSGGTGVNLDDTVGNRPRTAIMMTPPFTANDMAQAIGRIHRLNTKSNSRVRGVLSDTAIDQWNAKVLESKFKTLGAIGGGDIQRGKEAIGKPPEADGLESHETQPFDWGTSLHFIPKHYAPTPFAHKEAAAKFGGRPVKQNGDWITEFPDREAYEKYKAHVATNTPKPQTQPSGPVDPSRHGFMRNKFDGWSNGTKIPAGKGWVKNINGKWVTHSHDEAVNSIRGA